MIHERGEFIQERYQIIRIIEKGGMSVVYLAQDLELGSQVAIKQLDIRYSPDKRSRERFKAEAKIMQQLKHPNIVQLYQFIEPKKSSATDFYIVMEYMAGGSLENLLNNKSLLTIQKVVKIAIDLSRGLSEAHRLGIIHRDIKPSNILFDTTDEIAKIGDFGVAHIPMSGLTTIGQPGTLLWQSPEQAMNKEVDARSDLYSMGVVIYQMLSDGKYYINLEDHLSKSDPRALDKLISQAIIHDVPQKLSLYRADLPDALNRIVMKNLAKKPEKRYQDASEIIADLESILTPDNKKLLNKTKDFSYKAGIKKVGLLPRFISGLIDIFILCSIFGLFAALLAFIFEKSLGSTYSENLLSLAFLPVLVYYPVCWCCWRQTPGMKILGITLVNKYNFKPQAGAIFIRYCIYLIYLATIGILFFQVAFNKDRVGLYDKFSNTFSISCKK